MNYDSNQLKAIEAEEQKVLVMANAGSGKTSTIVGAIDKFMTENPGANLVAITFTKKAAAELSLKTIMHPTVQASTIHSWSLKELNRLGRKHKFLVSLLQELKIKELLLSISKRFGYYSLNQFLLYSYITGNYNIDVPDEVKGKFRKVGDAYIKFKRDNRLYDFMDLPLYLYDVLTEYDEEIELDALFVDEFQDVDDVQAQVFKRIKANKYFFVGDTRQSIYLFRDASPEVLKQFADFTRYSLNYNYRSYQPIVDFANKIYVEGSDGYIECLLDVRDLEGHNEIECVRGSRGCKLYTVDEDSEVALDLINNTTIDTSTLLQRFMATKPYILCRSNKQVKRIKELGYENVSTVHQAKGLEYDNVIVTNFDLSSVEEVNVAYVACTRAKNGMIIADYDTFLRDLSLLIYDNPELLTHNTLF